MAIPKRGGLGRGLGALFADAVPVVVDEEEDIEDFEAQKELSLETEEDSEGDIEDQNDNLNEVSSNKQKNVNEPTKKKSNRKKRIEKADEDGQMKMGEDRDDDEDKVMYIDIHSIVPNVNQPRKSFDPEKIQELADSIREHGIIQPIVVRRKNESYEIVAGERRWRAAMNAELTKIPAIIRNLDDKENMLFAIIENMQRENLNPVEEAKGLNQMIASFGMTQEEVSKTLGKSRPYITNSLRLLKLPDYILDDISDGSISSGHGRTLITVEDREIQKKILEKIKEEGLSVRETEKLVGDIGKTKKKGNKSKKDKDPNVISVEEELKLVLGTKVSIHQSGKKGKIEIEYFSSEELERLIELLRIIKQG